MRPLLLVAALAALTVLSAPVIASAAASDAVWLCRPGQVPDPCKGSLETTYLKSDGTSEVRDPKNARKPKADCFYVYPTVSNQPTTNADKSIDPEETAIAETQAARYSQTCRVFAPMYRQLTLAAINTTSDEGQAEGIKIAYGDVLAAWRDYMRNYNHGRGVILIGHSQGAGMLIGLLRKEIEKKRSEHKRLISAILLGGNATVKKGSDVGGSFRRTPACKSVDQTRCVIAFSTFNETPPDHTKFGRPSGRFADVFDIPSGPDQRVICTNPADLKGNEESPLRTLSRSEPFPPGLIAVALTILYGGPAPAAGTPWIAPQDHYTGRCVRENEANVLNVAPIGVAKHLNPSPDSTWGLHLVDANIGLGNLVSTTRRQIRAYLRG